MKGYCRWLWVLIGVLVFSVDAHAQGDRDSLQFLDTNGLTLAYRVVGTGEPLLMLHGFMGNDGTWGSVAEEFPGYKLIIPLLPGHGASTNPSGEFHFHDVAIDMFGLLDHLGVNSFKAVGFSAGGLTLMHMATAQPERVEAMVLIGVGPYFTEQAREVFRSYPPDSVGPDLLETWARGQGGDVAKTRQLFKEFYEFKDEYRDPNFTPPLLSTISARTLIIEGDRDMFFPVELPVEMYRAIAHSYLWIVPDGDHSPYPADIDQRSYFFSMLRQFLAGEWK